MKKLILALVLALLTSVSAKAQQARFTYANTTTGASTGVLEIGSGIQFHQLTWNVSGSVPTCQVQLDQSTDNITWSSQIIATQTCTSNGQSTVSVATVANYVRINITTKSGAGNVTVTYLGFTSAPSGGGTITGSGVVGDLTGWTAPTVIGPVRTFSVPWQFGQLGNDDIDCFNSIFCELVISDGPAGTGNNVVITASGVNVIAGGGSAATVINDGQFTLFGGTSGEASISVAPVAGMPCTIFLPITSPTTGQALSSAAPSGGNCQTSWVTPSSGNVSNQVLNGIPYNSSGTATALNAAIAAPTTNGQYNCGYTVTASVSVVPTCPKVGLAPDQAANATVLYSDNNSVIYNPAAAVALPTPTTLNNTTFFTTFINNLGTTFTITPVTLTISLNGAAGGATAVGPAHSKCSLVLDQVVGTQWDLDCTGIGTSTAFSVITSATNTTAAMVVGTGASLAFTGTATLDMSADTAATAFKVPVGAGFTASANGVINYDSTAGNTHVRTAGADSLSVGEASAIANGFLPMSTSATNSLIGATLCDQGITTANRITCSNTDGIASPRVRSTTTTAGFSDYSQGSTSAADTLCATATSICEQAPTTVTSYLITKPGISATGIETNNVSAAVITQGFSGDANHSATVTIGSGTSIGSTTLCSSANCPAGTYVVHVYIDITTACGTTGTYIVNLIYTDDQGAKTVVVNINGTGAVPATGVLTTTSTANFGENSQVLRLASGNLNYSTIATACGTAGPMVGKLYFTAVPVM